MQNYSCISCLNFLRDKMTKFTIFFSCDLLWNFAMLFWPIIVFRVFILRHIDQIHVFFFIAASDWIILRFLPLTDWLILRFFSFNRLTNFVIFSHDRLMNTRFFFSRLIYKFSDFFRRPNDRINYFFSATKVQISHFFRYILWNFAIVFAADWQDWRFHPAKV